MINSKHNFRLSALMAALALGASAPTFAHSGSRDASLADSMAVGGDTSSTYQRFDSPLPAQPAAPVASQPLTVASTPQGDVATARPDTPNGEAEPSVAATANAPVISTDASTVASADAPAVAHDLDVLVLIASDQPLTPDTAPAIAEQPAVRAEPVATLEPEIITREQVRDELRIARQSGTVSRNGELADTQDVLIARDEFNAAQTVAIMAEYRAEQDRQLALAEQASRRSEIEAEAIGLAALTAMTPADDQPMQVRIDVLDMSGE